MNQFWQGRGVPWEYDPGPPKNRRWARLFAETPNYRGLSRAVLGSEKFRWHFGPMFYRGRLTDNGVKVLIIGQEGAQDESLARRSFTGGTGARMQHLLNYLGISHSYLFLNSFVYPIHGQYDTAIHWLAQNPSSPIVQHRHQVFDYVLARNDVRLVIAVGNAARDSVVTWVASHGGACPGGADLTRCDAHVLGPRTKAINVMHPGGAGQGGSITAIVANFRRAIDQIREWVAADPAWLPPDPLGSRQLDLPYRYVSAPIPFRDFPFGTALRLGRGGTSSNRRDGQRSIQIFSAGGVYNATGAPLAYTYEGEGSQVGYEEEPGDLPYEPPRARYHDYDRGPGASLARLLLGGRPGLAWPDFQALGATAHPSFGTGPVYRGRPSPANVFILADQQSHDGLFSGRALTGESGQHMQPFLAAIGIRERYLIIRTLPVDTLGLSAAAVAGLVDDAQTRKVHQAILDTAVRLNPGMRLGLTFGPYARRLAQNLNWHGLDVVHLKAWQEAGALADWQAQLQVIKGLDYAREVAQPAYAYDGRRGQIPRLDLPYGTQRWVGTSGDRASQAFDLEAQRPSPDYFKLYMPLWAHRLKAVGLTEAETAAVGERG